LIRIIATALTFAVLTACAANAQHFSGIALPVKPAPDFTLTADTGLPWTLSQQRGKVVALFFGYSHCQDTCPDTLAKLAAALRKEHATAKNAEIAFVTVDPQRDTPGVLHAYIRRFAGARIVALTGSQAAVANVEHSYHVWAQRLAPQKGGGYDEAHSSYTFLIDRRGDERVIHDDDDSLHAFEGDFRILLQ
jgi:protein SCO1